MWSLYVPVYAKHDVTEQHEITILPVTFSITRNEFGDVQLTMMRRMILMFRDIPLRVRARLSLPARSPHGSSRDADYCKRALEGVFFGSEISLHDTEGKLVATTLSASTRELASTEVSEVLSGEFRLQKEVPALVVAGHVDESVALMPEVVGPTSAPVAAKTATEQKNITAPKRWPYAALIIVLLGALLVIFSKKSVVTNSQ